MIRGRGLISVLILILEVLLYGEVDGKNNFYFVVCVFL